MSPASKMFSDYNTILSLCSQRFFSPQAFVHFPVIEGGAHTFCNEGGTLQAVGNSGQVYDKKQRTTTRRGQPDLRRRGAVN